MLEIFDKYRTKEGMIDLDQISNLTFVNMPLRGSRPKFWFSYLDALYLFKEEKNSIESVKEIINEELAIQFGLENASYDLATYQGKKGVISKDFIENREFIPFLFLLFKRPKISNDLATICDILETDNLKREQILKIAHSLFRNHLLDIFTTQRDRNVENQGFIINEKNYFLAPRYDSAGSFLTIASLQKFTNFNNHPHKIQLLEKYKGYRTKFSLCPETVKLNAIDILLNLVYGIIPTNSFYLQEVLKSLDPEIQKIYLLNLKEIYQKLQFYNIKLNIHFKKFMSCVIETKINEFEIKKEVIQRGL